MQRPVKSRKAIAAPIRTMSDMDNSEANLPIEVREIPMGLRRAAAWSWRIILVIALGALAVTGLSQLSTILIAVLIAALLASMLQPIVKVMSDHTFLPRAVSALIVLLSMIALVVGMFVLAGRQLFDSWETIAKAAVSGFNRLIDDITKTFNLDLEYLSRMQNEALQELINQIQNNASGLISGASSAAGTVGNFTTGIMICLFTLFFFLSSGGTIWRFFLQIMPHHARANTHEAFRRGWKSLSSYCRTQIIVAAVDATGIALGMVGIDVVSNIIGRSAAELSPYAVPIWLIVFLFSFVPLLGAILSGAIATLIVFVLQGWIPALVMLGIVLLVQQLESNILQPILMGKAVELHPLAVFLGVTAGAVIAGIPGALFAIPLIAFVNAIYSYLDGRDPAPELGVDYKTHAHFKKVEEAKREFFIQQNEKMP